jgi:hypothetical protein
MLCPRKDMFHAAKSIFMELISCQRVSIPNATSTIEYHTKSLIQNALLKKADLNTMRKATIAIHKIETTILSMAKTVAIQVCAMYIRGSIYHMT